ncbi:MAG: anti-sigma F factor [Clostridia bacterium]|nr:anti-sigma F factor [Clostridia bacterium]
MNRNEMTCVFTSKSQNESLARMVAAAFVAQLNPTIEELADVRTAVSEAVTNSIVHGYGDREGVIELRFLSEGDILRIQIRDYGVGIEDVELAKQPFYTSKDTLERSGMGFAVMEAFMDTLEVESTVGEGTTVAMTKRIGADDE